MHMHAMLQDVTDKRSWKRTKGVKDTFGDRDAEKNVGTFSCLISRVRISLSPNVFSLMRNITKNCRKYHIFLRLQVSDIHFFL